MNRCNFGVGCEEYGVCYASANGKPEMCGLEENQNMAYTAEEACTLLIEAIWARVRYWEREGKNGNAHAFSGLAFSLLVLLDGTGSSVLPGMELVLRPHPDDKEYHLGNGQNYFEDGMAINESIYLHEMFYEDNDESTD
jgi:hypothetical protein